MWRSFKEGQSDVRELKKKRYQRVGGGERAGESCVKARDLEIVSKRGSHARFPKKHEQGRHPKIPCILVPALGWRKLFTLSISHC